MPRKQIDDLTGKKIKGTSWTVVKLAERRKTKGGTAIVWQCRCSCGAIKNVLASNLRSGGSRCCLNCSRTGKGNPRYRHGHSPSSEQKITPTYKTWATMVSRCDNPKHVVYKHYGGKGVTVCQRWRDFTSFLADMGERPGTMRSIERSNKDTSTKHYSCGKCEQCLKNGWIRHCRWATRHEQARNKSNNRILTYNGKTQCLTDWATELEMSTTTLYSRIYSYGWTVEKAIETPVRGR